MNYVEAPRAFERLRSSGGLAPTANLRTEILELRRFDSSRILILRGGILMSIGDFPESLSQAILVGIMLLGRFVVKSPRRRRGKGAPTRSDFGRERHSRPSKILKGSWVSPATHTACSMSRQSSLLGGLAGSLREALPLDLSDYSAARGRGKERRKSQ